MHSSRIISLISGSRTLKASIVLAFFVSISLCAGIARATYFADTVGIGTTTPQYRLSVYSTSSTEKLFQVSNVSIPDMMVVDENGNMGIGNASPTQKLDVAGNIAIGINNCVNANGVCAFKKQAGGADFHFVPDLASTSASNIFIGYNSSAPVSIGGGSYTKPYFIRFNADNNIRMMTAGAERVRIDESGKVGIGTTAPNRTLAVNGQLGLQTSGAEYGLLQTTTNGLYIYGGGNGRIIFMSGLTSPTEKMRVNEAGYVGIGTNTPMTNLSVTASKSLPGQMFELQNTNANDGSMRFYQMQDASGGIISFSGTPVVASAPNGTALTAITSATQDYPTATRGANFLESVNGNFHVGTVRAGGALFRPLTILNTGYVGIGVSTPQTNFDVVGGGTGATGVQNLMAIRNNQTTTGSESTLILTNTTASSFARSSGSGEIGVIRTNLPSAGNSEMVFRTTDNTTPTSLAERMRINYLGNVGIATTTPSEKLEVNGNIKVNGNIVSDGDICIGKCN